MMNYRGNVIVKAAAGLVVMWLAGARPAARGAEGDAATFSVNVKDMGAVGDGVADDGPAIRRATDAVTAHRGGTLFFPEGSYRCGRESDTNDGIKFAGVDNIVIRFAPKAELVMDNLNPQTGMGERGHGVSIFGPAKNITLLNVSVRWARAASKRSRGDGFRFTGFPEADKTLSNITMENCRVGITPQAGAIFMGCSNVRVTDFAAEHTGADGLHFNACQKVFVKGYHAKDNGDDGLAFVTYAPSDPPSKQTGPFSLPALGEWSDTDSVASDIDIQDGRANGVRISGGSNISVSNVRVAGRQTGIIIDSAKLEHPKVNWTYQASRGIKINNLVAEHCTIGLLIINHNAPVTDSPDWWKFDVEAGDLHVETSTQYGVCLTRCAGVRLGTLALGKMQLRKEGMQAFNPEPANGDQPR